MVRTCAGVCGLLMLLAAESGSVRGQLLAPKEAPLAVDQATVNTVIGDALKALEERYVFPEVSAKMAEAVRRRQQSQEYADVKTGQELAERLTKHLQDVSKDKHLRVRCSTEKRQPPPQGGPTAEAKARMKRMQTKMNAGFRKVERLPGNVGYLAFDHFADAAEVAEIGRAHV